MEPGTLYVVEKVMRQYPKFSTHDTIIEYAMCISCYEDIAKELAPYGATVHAVQHDTLKSYLAEPFTLALAQLAKKIGAELIGGVIRRSGRLRPHERARLQHKNAAIAHHFGPVLPGQAVTAGSPPLRSTVAIGGTGRTTNMSDEFELVGDDDYDDDDGSIGYEDIIGEDEDDEAFLDELIEGEMEELKSKIRDLERSRDQWKAKAKTWHAELRRMQGRLSEASDATRTQKKTT